MPLVMHRPAPALAPFVAHLWHFEDPGGALQHARERVLPSGTMQLLINLDADELRSYHGPAQTLRRTRGATLGGPCTTHFAIDTAEQRQILGVSFHPGGARPFFAAPAEALRETDVEVD